MSKRRVRIGGNVWNDIIRSGKDGVTLLRHDIEEIRIANVDNPEVLNFLLKMSSRLDQIYDALVEVQEIGGEYKAERLKNGDDDDG